MGKNHVPEIGLKKLQESDYYYFIVGYVTPVLRDLLQVTERKD